MARIVLGLGTSHSPMLVTREDELGRLVERDENNLLPFRDSKGRKISYQELLATVPESGRDRATLDKMIARARAADTATERLRRELADARLDALVIVGDDQNELMGEDNRPSLSVYYGETIANGPPPPMPGMAGWLVDIRSRFWAAEGRPLPVAHGLARHMIEALVEKDFDVASSRHYADGQAEGHAIAYIHNFIMDAERPVPVVPVLLNTFYAPNRVTPRRAYQIGRAIAEVVEAYPENLRVGVLASGGLSHFVIDEGFDQRILAALAAKDKDALLAVPREQLVDGTSETLNWICAAGALEALPLRWSEYVPAYRSPAGTGTGLAFAAWH
ncbi:MAG TPA: hypothetical protein VD995_22425 [Azospirillum sp.]|nr:hypothetical protein [Azospirillum sp.]